MYILIKRYIENMDIYTLKNLFLTKNIDLSDEELKFAYHFIKNNYQKVIESNGIFDIDKYKSYFSDENFIKIKKLIKEYRSKYSSYLENLSK